jgi:hypothetical protein
MGMLVRDGNGDDLLAASSTAVRRRPSWLISASMVLARLAAF